MARVCVSDDPCNALRVVDGELYMGPLDLTEDDVNQPFFTAFAETTITPPAQTLPSTVSLAPGTETVFATAPPIAEFCNPSDCRLMLLQIDRRGLHFWDIPPGVQVQSSMRAVINGVPGVWVGMGAAENNGDTNLRVGIAHAFPLPLAIQPGQCLQNLTIQAGYQATGPVAYLGGADQRLRVYGHLW